MSKTIKNITKQLQQSLSKDNIDFDKILDLSHQLAALDKDNVRFTTDAGIISRLGYELVGRQETAVAELIKNAYDADATKVDLIFYHSKEIGGTLEIDDNGTGMTREDIINGFMRLAGKKKEREPISPKYSRQRAGRKGIGRFAAQRLGKKLEIISQTKNSKKAYKIIIDWEKFEGGKNLFSISNLISEVPKEKEEGTKLIIHGLKEKWSKSDLQRIFRYVSSIIQPFPIANKNSKIKDKGFSIGIFSSEGDDLELEVDETTEIIKYAIGEIEGEVNTEKNGSWTYKSKKYSVKKTKRYYRNDKGKKIAFAHLKNIKFKIFYFFQPKGEEVYPRNLKKTINTFAKKNGGIRIYRNGFKVPPYGNQEDDWLGLADSTARRKVLGPHGNINFYGFVEIKDVDGNLFQEKSSREGLIEKPAFKELQLFLYNALTSFALAVSEAREKKGTAGQKNWKPTSKKLQDAVDDLATDEDSSDSSTNEEEKKEKVKKVKELVAELIDENAMLRVLASLGISIGEFTHEIKQNLTAVNLQIKDLIEGLIGQKQLLKTAKNLQKNILRFGTYASYFDQSLRENIERDLIPQELGEIITEFEDAVFSVAEKRGIKIIIDFKEFDLYTTPMHNSEWASILSNFFSNSIKAIQNVDGNGKILIRAGSEEDYVFLEFLDNGDGISKEHETQIFNAFFTTRGSKGRLASEEEELTGLGLGLKIVADIVHSYEGIIELRTPLKGYSTCLRIEIPKASKEELQEYGL